MKQAVAELCQAQVQFKLDSNFSYVDLYLSIRKVDQEIKRLKQKDLNPIQMQYICRCTEDIIQFEFRWKLNEIQMQYRCNLEKQIISWT